MCLAVPMKILRRGAERGEVEMDGARREVMLTLVPGAQEGDFVIVHAGYALEVIDETEAQRTLELLRQISESGD